MAKQKKYVTRSEDSPKDWFWDKPRTVEAKSEFKIKPRAPVKLNGWADEGKKADDGKLPYDLLPHDAITEIVKVLQFGAKKYESRNWEKGMHWSRPYAALMRHMFAWWRGQARDPETNLSHLAHAGCCILFLLAFWLRNVGTDDRPLDKETPANE